MKTTVRDTEAFANILKEELMKRLDPDIYSIIIEKMPKNNQVKTGICVRRGNCGAVLYAEDILEDLEGNPRPVEMIAQEVAQNMVQNLPAVTPQEIEELMKWENVQNSIELRLVNTDRNKVLLASSPHRDFFDLSLVYYVAVNSRASARVDNHLMQNWGVSEEELFNAGCKTMREKNPVRVRTIVSAMQNMIPCFAIEPPEDAVPLYMLGDSSNPSSVQLSYIQML